MEEQEPESRLLSDEEADAVARLLGDAVLEHLDTIQRLTGGDSDE